MFNTQLYSINTCTCVSQVSPSGVPNGPEVPNHLILLVCDYIGTECSLVLTAALGSLCMNEEEGVSGYCLKGTGDQHINVSSFHFGMLQIIQSRAAEYLSILKF